MVDDKSTRNPADAPLVTFDYNVLIALRDNEPSAPEVQALLDLNRAGCITVNVTMSSAMEAERPGEHKQQEEMIAWLVGLGINRSNIYTTSRSVGFAVEGFGDVPVFDPELEIRLNQHVHAILFEKIPFRWPPYRDRETAYLSPLQHQALLELETALHGMMRIPPRSTPALDALSALELEQLHARLEALRRKWFNAKNDSQGLYNHLTVAWHTTHSEHAVFVTSDRNFRKQSRLGEFRALGYRGEILPPQDALEFVRGVITFPP